MRLKTSVFFILSVILSAVPAWGELTKTEVSQLYVSIFGRASEGQGNTYWQTYESTASAANAMLDTDAAQNYFGDSLNASQAFVEHIYLNTLNKTIYDDFDGIMFWTGLLNSGLSRGEVVAQLAGVIDAYGPGGRYHDPGDNVTVMAYHRFANRVEISDYMAEMIWEPPVDWDTITQFSEMGMAVTDDYNTVVSAKAFINSLNQTTVARILSPVDSGSVDPGRSVQVFFEYTLPENMVENPPEDFVTIVVESDLDGILYARSREDISLDTCYESAEIHGFSIGTHRLCASIKSGTAFSETDCIDITVGTVTTNDQVTEGNAGFTGLDIVAPGAEILSRGQLSADQIPVSEDGLVAIIKDEDVFFYHPAIGTRELSLESSILSVRYFLEGIKVKTSGSNMLTASLKSGSEEKIEIGEGETEFLPTGLVVERTGEADLTISNTLNRWAAVTVDAYTDTPYFFMPRGNWLPSNIIDILQRFIREKGFSRNLGQSFHTRQDISAMEKLETYGAFKRGYDTDPYLPYHLSVLEAERNNRKLVESLNNIDFSMSWIRLGSAVAGVIPFECADLLTGLLNAGMGTLIINYYIDESFSWDSAAAKNILDSLKDAVHSLIFCWIEGVKASSGILLPASVAWEVFLTLWDIATMIVTGHQEMTVAPFEQITASAYAAAFMKESPDKVRIEGFTATPSEPLQVGSKSSITVECRTIEAEKVTVDLSFLGGPSNAGLTNTGPYAYDWDWQTWQGQFDVIPSRQGAREIWAVASNSNGNAAQTFVSLDVAEKDDTASCDELAPRYRFQANWVNVKYNTENTTSFTCSLSSDGKATCSAYACDWKLTGTDFELECKSDLYSYHIVYTGVGPVPPDCTISGTMSRIDAPESHGTFEATPVF